MRVKVGGHVAEGKLVATDKGFKFDGELICGPHDAEGGHVLDTRRLTATTTPPESAILEGPSISPPKTGRHGRFRIPAPVL